MDLNTDIYAFLALRAKDYMTSTGLEPPTTRRLRNSGVGGVSGLRKPVSIHIVLVCLMTK